jgi:hypothetical protein
VRDDLVAGEDDLCGFCKEAILLCLFQICVGDLGCGLASGLLLVGKLRHWSMLRMVLELHKQRKSLWLWSAGAKSGARKKTQWRWRKSKGRVTNKQKGFPLKYTFMEKNVGCNVAQKAEETAHSCMEDFKNYQGAHVRRSASIQINVYELSRI